MREFLTASPYFCILLTLVCYVIGLRVRRKTGLFWLNPLLIAIILVIASLLALGIEPDAYTGAVRPISSLLTPATLCLAVPLYEKLHLLRRHPMAIVGGILSGVLTSLVCILGLCVLLSMQHAHYVTLLPKSVTTAIAIGICEEAGGYVPVTVSVVLLTGIFGSIVCDGVFRLLRITDPIARGIALGTSSHAVGTSRAMEIGKTEGAMSSLSIVVAGGLTVLFAGFFAGLY